jgi:ADP-heptose:LPS heptosyltransferase
MQEVSQLMKRILVIQQKMIGDVLLSSILCNNLRKAYPDAEIDYLVHEHTIPVLAGNPNISRIIPFPRPAQESAFRLLAFAFGIRAQRYDLLIDAYSKLESWIITALSGAGRKISYKKKGREFLYTDCVPVLETAASNLGLAIERRLSLLSPLNLRIAVDPIPRLFVSSDEKLHAASLFETHGLNNGKKNLMVSVAGSEPAKTYPADYMAALLDIISDTGRFNMLFNYLPSQEAFAHEVFKRCRKTTQQQIYFGLHAASLREFIAIMSCCDGIFGNDGGAINMAKALDKPAFTIYSPWIEKEVWATLEDGKRFVSVHLKDYCFAPYRNAKPPDLKKQAALYYRKFYPQLFMDSVSRFAREI